MYTIYLYGVYNTMIVYEGCTILLSFDDNVHAEQYRTVSFLKF